MTGFDILMGDVPRCALLETVTLVNVELRLLPQLLIALRIYELILALARSITLPKPADACAGVS